MKYQEGGGGVVGGGYRAEGCLYEVCETCGLVGMFG